MNLQDASLLERMQKNLDELIQAGRKLGPLYTESPKLVADITRKAKWLRTAIKTFQESQEKKEAKT
jgi:hypothetical protein